ncbi:MAG: HEAT repeat domain-containing protein [Gemmatimonadaceae bacterium]
MRRFLGSAVRGVVASAVLVTAAAAGAAGAARATRAREESPQVPGAAPIIADDTASLNRLLRTVRGVDPLLCELATRSVDTHGWWSRWGGGPLSGDPLVVDSAAAALIAWIQRKHNDPAVVPRLRAALRDPDPCVRRIGASFLGRVDHPAAVAALVEALTDASAGTRAVAALGLGLSGKPGLVEPIVRRLKDESPVVRRAAAWALGSLEDAAAIPPLIELLQRDADPRVRQAAAWAIGSIHD